ncbi:YjbQ family protein [Streptococcus halichoeri]|uniref:YjbQ family protein n=1 Tax=Streptococcus halichoeri TaxID=254785 RepID=UPI001358EC68|nr:YjbQ family protein [Streptococcus halichoeri]
MTIYKEEVVLQTQDRVSYVDITDKIKKIVERSGIKNGVVMLVTPHTTCSIIFEEYTHDVDENGYDFLQVDLNNILEQIIPRHLSELSYKYPGPEHYKTVKSWPNVSEYLPDNDPSSLWNGDAHIKATLLGSSQMIDVLNGKLNVGKTGYYYFVDFDQTRGRTRKCLVTIIGE